MKDKKLIEIYRQKGIDKSKIYFSEDKVCVWSITRNSIVDNVFDDEEVIYLSLLSYDKIKKKDIRKANRQGIIISNFAEGYYNYALLEDYLEENTHNLNIGYHLTEIPKGEIGAISKIEEELLELKDADEQSSKIMKMVELADLYGAVEEYAANEGLTMEDLKKFSNITKRAFKNGRR